MRRLFALLLSMLWVCCQSAWASFPATSTPNVTTYYYNAATDALNFTSMSALIAHYKAANSGLIVCGAWTATPKTSCAPIEPTVRDTWSYNVPIHRFYATNGGYYDGGTQIWYKGTDTILSCPANSTLSGSSCTCDADFLESNGSCVAPSCNAGSVVGMGYLSYSNQGATTWCQAGCTVKPAQVVIDGSGAMYANGNHYQTGETCSQTPEVEGPKPEPDPSLPPDKPGCQPGFYYGQVNGVTVCVPGSSSSTYDPPKTTTTTNADGSGKTSTTTSTQTTGTTPNGTTTNQLTQQTLEMLWEAATKTTFSGPPSVPSTVAIPSAAGETKSTTVTNPDGSVTKYDVKKNEDGSHEVTTTNGTVKKTETTTNCTGSNCTSTTTESTNGTKTSETSGQSSLDGLCKANPELKLCGTDKEGSFQGVCESGYTCEGDAVQCAQALAIRELQCSAKKLPDGVETEAADLLQGKVPDGFHLDGPGLSPPTSVTGSCGLTDFQVAWIFDSTLSVEMSRFCQFMDAIRAVIGIMGALAFATIVFKG